MAWWIIGVAHLGVDMASKSGEFSRSRNVNKMRKTGGSTTASPLVKVGASRVKRPPANMSNTYGITARAGSKQNARGSAPGADRGNALFGSGSPKPSSGATAPRRTGRRGGR